MATNATRAVALGDVVDLLAGFPFTSERYSGALDDVRLLRGDNIVQGSLRWGDAKRWPAGDAGRLGAYALDVGDVVLAMDRPWIEAGLKYAAVNRSDVPALLVQRVARLRARPGFDQRFLKYVVGGRAFTNYVLGVQTGTAVPHISSRQILEFAFLCPSFDAQRAIARILGALDDKIELNRKTNETLEAMARTLFKSWFVDFDPVRAKAEGRRPEGMDAETAALFPASLTESPLGDCPRGWATESVRELVEGVYDGPHATPPDAADGAIFLGIRNFLKTRLDLSYVRYIAESDWARWTRRVLPRPGDIVFTYEATLGHFAVIPEGLRCCLGRRTALVRPRHDAGDGLYLFHWFIAPPFQDYLRARVNPGSTVDRILLTDFPSYAVLAPPVLLRQRFSQVIAPTWRLLHARERETRSLEQLRDTLLPKLMSGELRVRDAERAVETAT